MGKRGDGQPRKRFSKSGHTTHLPRVDGPYLPAGSTPPPPTRPTRPYEPPADPPAVRRPANAAGQGPRYRDERGYRDEPRYDDGPRYRGDLRHDDLRHNDPPPHQGARSYRDEPAYADDRGYRGPPPGRRYDDEPLPDDRDYRDGGRGPRTYRDDPADPYASSTHDATAPLTVGPPGSQTLGRAALGLGKATVTNTNKAARAVTRKVITASKSDGAAESGLTSLIWNQVLSYGTDAMVTVALAGTVFFGASAHAQRGNILLYLLVTMAPFALIAPIIGPALDRLQHGRRWTMAGTAIGRAALALVMAAHPTDLLVLYPCALGSLVLSKAYGVVRAAAAPRLVPRGMTLTAANAKLTIFGLGSTVVLGGLVGVIIKVSGSYTLGLVVTAVAFAACGFFAFKLPPQVDSAAAAPRHPQEPPRPRRQQTVPPLHRLHGWARRGFDPHLVAALQGESVLRLLSGMLTIYLAFYVESTSHGLTGVLELGGVIAAAGAGNFLGTAIGTRLRMVKPETMIAAATCVAAASCIIGALTFTILIAIVVMLVCAVTNALSKIALDSLIQNDVPETLRSSAFAKSETFLQLAWVVGATLGVALPSQSTGDGTIALLVAAVITAAVAAVVVLRTRVASRGPGTTSTVARSLD